VIGPDFREDVRFEQQEDLGNELERFLWLSWVSSRFEDGQASDSVLEKLAEELAIGLVIWWITLPAIRED
jgi:hypothetical protein